MLKILAYHHILSSDLANLPKSNRFVSVKEFEKQVKFLSESFTVVKLNSLSEHKFDVKSRQIAITVDDGYKNFLENGFPILEKYNLPVTLFVPSKKIGKKIFEEDYGYEIEYLSSEEIYTISKSKLVSIQAHGHKHVRLTELNREQQEREIKESKRILQEITKEEINGFCFPYGCYNDITKSILKAYNFFYACTTNTGLNLEPYELLELKRIAINSKFSINDFANLL